MLNCYIHRHGIQKFLGQICHCIIFSKILFLEREKGREKEERNVHRLPLTRALRRDWTHKLGMCLNGEQNRWLLPLRNNAHPTEPHWSGLPWRYWYQGITKAVKMTGPTVDLCRLCDLRDFVGSRETFPFPLKILSWGLVYNKLSPETFCEIAVGQG